MANRLLDVLAAFSAERPTLSLSELSRATGFALTTTHRLIGTLAAWGAVERGADGRYRIGLRLWEVGALAPRSARLRQSAMPFLEDLYEVTHQNVQLAVRDGHEVVYIEWIAGREAVHVVTRVGGRLPLHVTGVGLVLLAHASAEFQEEVLRSSLRVYTEKTISNADQLRRALATVRREGAAISDGQIEIPALSVAAPVYDASDEVIAALSVVVPARDVNPQTLVPAVRAAGRGISRSLGAPRALSADADRWATSD